MKTGNIQEFLKTYTDERLAALLAHTQDGKLAYRSCCCLLGASNAPHALRGEMMEYAAGLVVPPGTNHLVEARLSGKLAELTEEEFYFLGRDDAERRANLLPLIETEIARRSQEIRINQVMEAMVGLSTR